jgi:hypothetical protein
MSFVCTVLLALAGAANEDRKPTLYIVGDSTVKNGTPGQLGWDEALVQLFDPPAKAPNGQPARP